MTCSGEHGGCSRVSEASKEPIQKARTQSGSGRFQQLSVRVRVFTHVCVSVCTRIIQLSRWFPWRPPLPGCFWFLLSWFLGGPQIKFTDLAGHKTSVQRGFVFHFIENRQLFHREAARRAGVHSPGHSAHNQVPGAGGAHHSEHGRYSRRLPALPCGTSGVVSVSLPPILTVDWISAPLRLSLILWIQLGSAIIN